MRRPAFVPLVVWLVVMPLALLTASMPDSLFDVVSGSDVIVLATQKRITDDDAEYEVQKVYKGGALLAPGQPQIVRIAIRNPPGSPQGLISYYFEPRRLTQETVLFLKKPPKSQSLFEHAWHSPWAIEPTTREDDLKAIEHLLEVWAMTDERQRMETWMRDLESANSRLSSGAQDFIVHTAIRSPRKLDHKDLYLKLLTSPNRRQMSLGLTCFQEIPAPEAIPRLLELTLDKEANIASRTGLALRHYPTNMEVMRALITLTRNPDAHVRSQTMISMDRFDCPEVTTALLERLKDPDATVRAMVPRAFHYKSAETRAILSPKLLELLNEDPSPQVKASMIKAAGDDLPVARLFGYLQQKDLDTEMRVAVLGSLYVRFSHAPDTRLSAIREHEDLLVAQVMRTEHHMIGFDALCILSLTDSPRIREIISKAAREHRNDYVRQHAQYLAKKQQDALPPK